MRFRFSLRFLLILFTLLAIFLGLGGRYVYQIKDQARRHRLAIANLEELRTFVRPATDKAKPPTTFESLINRWVDNDAYPQANDCMIGMPLYIRLAPDEAEKRLEILRDVSGITELTIAIKRLTANAMQQLAAHQNLRYLKIECETIDPAAALKLDQLKALETLIFREACSDEVIVAASNLPHLAELTIHITQLGPRGAEALGHIKSLKRIDLVAEDQELPDPAPFLRSLAAMPDLTEIKISSFIAINDEAADALSRIQTLKSVRIEYCPSVPDDFLAKLSRLKQMESLIVTLWSKEPANFAPAPLAQCPKLRQIYFDHALFTAQNLRAFEAHPALTHLVIRGEVPLSDIKSFLQNTPNCELTIITPSAPTWGVTPESDGSQPEGAVYRWNAGKLETREPKWKAPWKPAPDA